MDWKLIKKYEEYENVNYKVFEDEIATVFFWLLGVFNAMISMVYGCLGPNDDLGYAFLVMSGFIGSGAMELCAKAIYTVREGNSIRANLYEKLRYIPVDLKMYCVARISRMAKYFARYTVIMELITLTVHLIYHKGLNLVFFSFAPIAMGGICIVIQGIIEYNAYSRVAKNV